MFKQKNILVTLLFCISVTTPMAMAQRGGGRIVTKTHLQVVFSDLEKQWLKAVQEKDVSGLDRYITEEFEVWTANPPGDPTPREDWIKAALSRKFKSYKLQQMAVRALTPEIAIANFVLSQTFEIGGKSKTEDEFIVDVWMKTGNGENTWRCSDRYASPVSPVDMPRKKKDVRPTGKQ